MSMDLKEALERIEAVRRHYEAKGDVAAYAPTAEALGVVLSAARENHAARAVADAHRVAAEVFRTTPHEFAMISLGSALCRRCLGSVSDPIHRPVTP
jgi:hypothetical protein